VPAPRRPVEPLLDGLIDGKAPKKLAAELEVTHHNVNQLLRRYVKESGCKTLLQAVVRYAKNKPG
jgi:DNA-binding CsgD family transcriptional regulator